MITKEDILQIIYTREEKLLKLLDKNSKKYPLSTLKKAYKDWWKEIRESTEFAKENNLKFPEGDLGFAYTFMNEFSAYFAHHTIAVIYIKKLEEELSKIKNKNPKK